MTPNDYALLPQATHGLPGQLGLCRAPGIRSASAHADLLFLQTNHGLSMLASLVPQDECDDLGIGNIDAIAGSLGVAFERHAITDYRVPSNAIAFGQFVDRIVSEVRGGKTVFIHCQGGKGRSGLVAACCLVACGQASTDAIGLVKSARRGAIETDEQRDYVKQFAAARGLP